jgi:mRNA (guanine-N7-)-methyltransferase
MLATFPDYRVMCQRSVASGNATGKFGNDVYSVEFLAPVNGTVEPLSLDALRTKPFGTQYSFSLGDAVQNCEESVVYLPAVDEVAREKGMRLAAVQNLGDFVRQHCASGDYDDLLVQMSCLGKWGESVSVAEWEVVQFYCVATFCWADAE